MSGSSQSWYQRRLILDKPLRIFGECYPDMVWYEDWKNGTKFFGEGPAVLKERLRFSISIQSIVRV
jgi:hypothetical protein